MAADDRPAKDQQIMARMLLEVVRADFATRARDWRKDHQNREVSVGDLLREARLRLVDRDLADAERLVEEAQSRWRESAEVQAFAFY